MTGFYSFVFSCFIIFVFSISGAYSEWQDVSPIGVTNDIYSISFSDKEHGYAVYWSDDSLNAVDSYLMKTTDGGESWHTLIIPYIQIFKVLALDSDNVILVGHADYSISGVIYLSNNGGANWKEITFWEMEKNGDTYSLFDFQRFDSLNFYTCGMNGKIFKSADGGKNWAEGKTNAHPLVFSVVNFPALYSGYAIAGPNYQRRKMIYKTVDRGLTWSLQNDFTKSDTTANGIAFKEGNHGFFFGYGDGSEAIFETSSSGQQWEKIYSGAKGQELQGGFFIENNGFAFGQDGNIVVSTDDGKSWKEEQSGKNIIFLSGTAVSDSGLITAYFAGGRGSIMKFTKKLKTSVEKGINDKSLQNLKIKGDYIFSTRENFDMAKLKIFNVSEKKIQSFEILPEKNLVFVLEH